MTRRKVYDPHGSSRTSAKVSDWRTLTTADIDRKLRVYLGRHQRNIAKTQQWYLNVRAKHGLDDGVPNYILSDFRFKDYRFPVSWIPPRPRGFAVVRKGSIRRWQFVVFHCFGESYDWWYLRRNRGLISVPTDVNGHNPRRWMGAVRYLTLWDEGKRTVSVHFNVSRRGDFISSVDLNDIAYASGGSLRVGFNKNVHSIGFELESHLARHIYRTKKKTRRVYRQPFSQKQLLCLAIALKKIHSWRSVVKIEPRFNRGEIVAAKKANAGGCIMHLTLHPGKRTDPGAQFNIPKGSKATFGSSMWNGTGSNPRNGPGPWMESGWDTVDRLFQKVRAVNPATQAFQKPLTPAAVRLAQASEIVNLTAHVGQTAAARSGRNRLAALSRSEAMQGQTRRTLYSKASANNNSLSSLITQANAVTSAVIRRFDTSVVVGISDAVMFDEETGLWEDGGA
jgi:hypothetical protein